MNWRKCSEIEELRTQQRSELRSDVLPIRSQINRSDAYRNVRFKTADKSVGIVKYTMNRIKFLLLPLLLSGCAHGLLGGLSAVDTSMIPGRPETYYFAGTPGKTAQSTAYHAHDPHPPAPRYEHDTRFLVGGKLYTYKDLGVKDAHDYYEYHDRTDPSVSRFTADQYRSSAYRYAKSGKRGSVNRRIAEYKHSGE